MDDTRIGTEDLDSGQKLRCSIQHGCDSNSKIREVGAM